MDGKPLVKAVVVFLPDEPGGTLTQGETGEDGTYELAYRGFPGGTSPGRYKIGVSYLISTLGTPLGLGERGSLTPPPEVVHAKERLPPQYSELTRTVLTAVVPPEGGTFDFDLEGPLLPPPEPAPPAGDAASPAKDESPPTTPKPTTPPARDPPPPDATPPTPAPGQGATKAPGPR